LKITRTRVLAVTLIGFSLFVVSGGIDLTAAFLTGWRGISEPVLTSLSPIAFMLYFFGTVGIWLIWHGATIIPTDEKLGKKQVESGFVMVYFIFLFLELLLRFGVMAI
jgi:hypothetical protein